MQVIYDRYAIFCSVYFIPSQVDRCTTIFQNRARFRFQERNTFQSNEDVKNISCVQRDVVDCGLTSHSAIFQLYSDRTDVQFPNFDLLPGTHAMDS